MSQYKLIALTNCVEKCEDEFNAWYDQEHVPETCAVPGILNGARFQRVGRLGVQDHSYDYLAIYDVETDDPQKFLSTLQGYIDTGKIARGKLYRPPKWTALYKPK